MPTKKVPVTDTDLILDWKEQPGLDDLRDALKPLGIFVYEHPFCEGTDSYGFIFSKVKLTKKQIKAAYSYDD